MQGMSLKSLKRHKALIPLYFCVGLGCLGAVGYTLRLALRNPDVQWNRKSGEISNEEFRAKQYKLYSPTMDYSNIAAPPKY